MKTVTIGVRQKMFSTAEYKIVKNIHQADKKRIQIFLSQSEHRNKEKIQKNIARMLECSLCIGLYKNKQLLAFGLMITDYGEFACITKCVNMPQNIAIEEKRKQQKMIIEAFRSHPKLTTIKKHKWFAITHDAQSIFASLGFINTFNPGVMIFTKDLYCDSHSHHFLLSHQRKKNVTLCVSTNRFNHPEAALKLLNMEDWGKNYTQNYLDQLIKHSRCYGMYHKNELIGFMRVVTNFKTVASFWDLVIDKRYRGKKYGTYFIQEIVNDQTLQNIDTWVFLTRNPHVYSLAKQFGFKCKSYDYVSRLPHPSDRFFRSCYKNNASEKAADNFYFYKKHVDNNLEKIKMCGAVVLASIALCAYNNFQNNMGIIVILGMLATSLLLRKSLLTTVHDFSARMKNDRVVSQKPSV